MVINKAIRASFLAAVGYGVCATGAWASAGTVPTGFVPPYWATFPFGGILLSIAVLPLVMPEVWEKHYEKISIAWLVLAYLVMLISVPTGAGFFDIYGKQMFFVYEEYLSFIILLGSLFIISGGVHIARTTPATPFYNTALLLIGGVLASVVGTTGAAMLLIRQLLKANAGRQHQVHVVLFFIFIVCNVGGALTPIGDPPLFLGFLQGVPFFWTLKLIPYWLVTLGILLVMFFLLDRYLSHKAGAGSLSSKVAEGHAGIYHDMYVVRLRGQVLFAIEGLPNLFLLVGVVGLVILSGYWHPHFSISVFGLGEWHGNALFRDGAQIILAGISLAITKRRIYMENNFTFAPIREVAILFVGIFTTIAPALMLLSVRGGDIGLSSPAAYMWVTGILSAFLDNAPTYLAFLTTAMGQLGIQSAETFANDAVGSRLLTGISVGAVFFGALTYIGNGPNFLVKSIAESEKIRMPSFFGYMLYASIVLLPIYGLLTWLYLV